MEKYFRFTNSPHYLITNFVCLVRGGQTVGRRTSYAGGPYTGKSSESNVKI